MKRPGIAATVLAVVAATAILSWSIAALTDDTQPPLRTPSLSLSTESSSTSTTAGIAGLETSASVRQQAEAAGSQSEDAVPPGGSAQDEDADATPDPAAPQGDSPSGDDPEDPTDAPAVTPALTLARRQACYWDLVAAQDRAVAEAEAAYPLDSDTADVEAHLELRASLTDQYETDVAQEYGITAAELDAIAQEGIASGWPMPPLEG